MKNTKSHVEFSSFIRASFIFAEHEGCIKVLVMVKSWFLILHILIGTVSDPDYISRCGLAPLNGESAHFLVLTLST